MPPDEAQFTLQQRLHKKAAAEQPKRKQRPAFLRTQDRALTDTSARMAHLHIENASDPAWLTDTGHHHHHQRSLASALPGKRCSCSLHKVAVLKASLNIPGAAPLQSHNERQQTRARDQEQRTDLERRERARGPRGIGSGGWFHSLRLLCLIRGCLRLRRLLLGRAAPGGLALGLRLALLGLCRLLSAASSSAEARPSSTARFCSVSAGYNIPRDKLGLYSIAWRGPGIPARGEGPPQRHHIPPRRVGIQGVGSRALRTASGKPAASGGAARGGDHPNGRT